MKNEIAVRETGSQEIERVLIGGDLSQLKPEERVSYYKMVCDSVGLNPLTRPLEYITLNGKLTLYARKDCTDQLRSLRTVSINIVAREFVEGCYVVTARATLPSGRQDESIGAVPIENLKGEARANALMKCETKAKRRVTLSICGLGILDETEIETVPSARPFVEGAVGAKSDTPVSFKKKVEPLPPLAELVKTATDSGSAVKADAGDTPASAPSVEAQSAVHPRSAEAPLLDKSPDRLAAETKFGVEFVSVQEKLTIENMLKESGKVEAPRQDSNGIQYSTEEQQTWLRLKFKEALPAKYRNDADSLRRDWLKLNHFVKPDGTGSSTMIPRNVFKVEAKRLLEYASTFSI